MHKVSEGAKVKLTSRRTDFNPSGVRASIPKLSTTKTGGVTKERSVENKMKQPNWACRQFH